MLATRIVELLQLLAAYPCFLFPDCKEHPFVNSVHFSLSVFDGLFPVADDFGVSIFDTSQLENE